MKIFAYVLLAVISSCSSVLAAVEQCRFIQVKADREACYDRQSSALAAKRRPDASANAKTSDSVEQMKREDDALNRRLRSICRGC